MDPISYKNYDQEPPSSLVFQMLNQANIDVCSDPADDFSLFPITNEHCEEQACEEIQNDNQEAVIEMTEESMHTNEKYGQYKVWCEQITEVESILMEQHRLLK